MGARHLASVPAQPPASRVLAWDSSEIETSFQDWACLFLGFRRVRSSEAFPHNNISSFNFLRSTASLPLQMSEDIIVLRPYSVLGAL